MGGLSSWTGLVISVAMALLANFISVRMSGFVLDISVPYLVPSTVDRGPPDATPPQLLSSPLWNNVVLLLGFGLQHSGMLRCPVKWLALLVLSEESFRVFYVAVTTVYLGLVFHLWAPMPYPLWDIQQRTLSSVILGLGILSWSGVILSYLYLDPIILLGVRPYFDQAFNREKPETNFVTTRFYGLVRHPMYSFMILGFWITPTMTVGHLLFAVIFTGYILFAVAQYEEPDLVKTIGPRYEEYQRTTPQYIPTLSSFKAAMGARVKMQ